MHALKTLMFPVLLIGSLIGFDNIYAAGDLTRLTTALPELRLGDDESDYSMSQHEYMLETGKAYQLKIIASGQKEYAFQAPEFATSIFLRKIEAEFAQRDCYNGVGGRRGADQFWDGQFCPGL